MKAVRAKLGHTLNIPARNNNELLDLIGRYEGSLLILDRCEAAINHAKTQFIWFLSQLLSKTRELKVQPPAISRGLPSSPADDAARTSAALPLPFSRRC